MKINTKLLEDYEDFMLKVLKMNHDENDAEILDVLNDLEQDDPTTGTGYYLYLLNGESTVSKNNIIGPFASINSQMLRKLAILYIRQHDIIDEKAFLSSPIANLRVGNNLIYSLEFLNTSYNTKPLEISDKKCKDINAKIYIYNQIRYENQQEKLIEAIKSLGFKIIYNL